MSKMKGEAGSIHEERSRAGKEEAGQDEEEENLCNVESRRRRKRTSRRGKKRRRRRTKAISMSGRWMRERVTPSS